MRLRPLIFGEVLFDLFPGDESRLGGAPFNAATHLAALGLNPLMISRIGNDHLGGEVLAVMAGRGMDVAGIQVDPDFPTGVVQVDIRHGGPTFNILDEQAYDYIAEPDFNELKSGNQFGLIYAGTLALRNAVSRNAFNSLKARAQAPLFVDLNLRAPWWDREILAAQIEAANWLKLNHEELAVVLNRKQVDFAWFRKEGAQLAVRFGVEVLAVTFGAEGAALASPEKAVLCGEPADANPFVDSVGAGDAFSAALMEGLLSHRSLEETLGRALFLGSEVCKVRGALLEGNQSYRALKTDRTGTR